MQETCIPFFGESTPRNYENVTLILSLQASVVNGQQRAEGKKKGRRRKRICLRHHDERMENIEKQRGC